MSRLRGSLDRREASLLGAMMDQHGIEAYQPFWKGYRDAARDMGLMIRVNGLPLALALAMDQAGIAGEFPPLDAKDDQSGRACAIDDLALRLEGKGRASRTPAAAPRRTPADLLALVERTTTADRLTYSRMVEAALATLLWQKTLSAARVKPDEKKRANRRTERGEEA